MSKQINSLDDAINAGIFKESINTSALYYGELKNNLSKSELLDMKKSNKYKNIYGDSTDIEKYADKTLKNTNLKRGICQSLLEEKTDYMINLPYIYNDNKDLDYISFKYMIKDNNINFEDTKKEEKNGNLKYNKEGLESDCRRFYGVYCENIKKRLKQQYGDEYSDDILRLHNPECACYADTLNDRYEKDPEKYKDFKDYISYTNDDRACQLTGCNERASYSPGIFNNKTCSDIKICKNEVKFDDTVMDHSDLSFIFNLSNNCGGEFKEGYEKQKEKKKEEPETPIKPDTPDIPETPDEPDTPTKPEEPEEPETPIKPEEPETPDTPDIPDTPEEPEDPKKSEIPDTPDIPEEPTEPTKPDEPETPDIPDTPEKPDEPKKPDTPISPDDPTTIPSIDPETPDTPETPEEPMDPSDEPEEPETPRKKTPKNIKLLYFVLIILAVIMILLFTAYIFFK